MSSHLGQTLIINAGMQQFFQIWIRLRFCMQHMDEQTNDAEPLFGPISLILKMPECGNET